MSTFAFHKGIGTQISLKDVSFFDVAQGNKIDTPTNKYIKSGFSKLCWLFRFLDTCTKITIMKLFWALKNQICNSMHQRKCGFLYSTIIKHLLIHSFVWLEIVFGIFAFHKVMVLYILLKDMTKSIMKTIIFIVLNSYSISWRLQISFKQVPLYFKGNMIIVQKFLLIFLYIWNGLWHYMGWPFEFISTIQLKRIILVILHVSWTSWVWY